MGSLYTSLTFIDEHDFADRTYLEWPGTAFDGDVAGVTIIEWDDSRRIAAVQLHQRPLAAVTRFAAALARRDLPGFAAADFATSAV